MEWSSESVEKTIRFVSAETVARVWCELYSSRGVSEYIGKEEGVTVLFAGALGGWTYRSFMPVIHYAAIQEHAK
jgi:hypothetical protein